MRILSSSVQICPQYDDFSFTNWDLNVEVRELFTLAQKYVRKMSLFMLNKVYDTFIWLL